MVGKERVEYLLKNYHHIKKDIEARKSLLKLSEEELKEYESQGKEQRGNHKAQLIEEMNFQGLGFMGDKVQTSNIADKTARIALTYEQVNRGNIEGEIRALIKDIKEKERELLKLEVAVGALEHKVEKVIRGIYFQGKPRVQICRELYISEVTVGRWRKKGVERMGEWWK